jgi:hypothetical protein
MTSFVVPRSIEMLDLTLYYRYTQPLFMQALMGVKGIYDAKPVQIHLFGKPAEGDLKRPFKAAPGLLGGKLVTTYCLS